MLDVNNENLYVLDATMGKTALATVTGLGGRQAGLSCGIAVDINRLYYMQLNSEGTP
jgi:hypothetical protein